ncbi:MAG TPA: hydrolase 1, exosortase A system-associated [Allosphingosinicella sp.]|jgi:exosortase A-associated hydrolase 1|uniref:hydrolase 1, exosortase A system-associated n=1 Tax=Allosphingosinicella sp. TaxID=2823234 RepID=UPI002F2A8E47
MRELMTFACAGSVLAGSLDRAESPVGLLIATGGTQTRIGSHRLFERLGASLAASGHPCFRFDRRGVGDSEGEDPGFRGSRDDVLAAAAAFRGSVPELRRLYGLGLCDGATALMLHGAEAGLNGLILANPWLVEASAGQPPPAAIRRLYAQRLTSREGWKRLLAGQVSLHKLAGGLRRAAAPTRSGLGREAIAALKASHLPVRLLLSRGDTTAIAAEPIWRSCGLPEPVHIETDSHTFARAGDLDALTAAVLQSLRSLSGQ